MLQVYENVGTSHHHHDDDDDDEDDPHSSDNSSDCNKANTGLFFGLLVSMATAVAVASFFVFDSRGDGALLNIHSDDPHDNSSSSLELEQEEKRDNALAASYIFYLTNLGLVLLSGVGVGLSGYHIHRLRFHVFAEGWLDATLLVVALFGLLTQSFLLMVSSSDRISSGNHPLSYLSLFSALLDLLQSIFQTAFILDGLRRCALSRDQARRKPGRAAVTFLLVCNLALWVQATFLVRETDSAMIHQEYYGQLAWDIISHLCSPLVIFYRFHSTVCLSDIWVHAYHYRPQPYRPKLA